MKEQLEAKRTEFAKLKPYFWRKLPHKCSNCGASENLHLHHIVPLSKGGNNILSNITPLCEECHGKVHLSVGSFISTKLRDFGISRDQRTPAKVKFANWLHEFAKRETGSKVKAKDVYSEELGIGRTQWSTVKKDPEILTLMEVLKISFEGQRIVRN